MQCDCCMILTAASGSAGWHGRPSVMQSTYRPGTDTLYVGRVLVRNNMEALHVLCIVGPGKLACSGLHL